MITATVPAREAAIVPKEDVLSRDRATASLLAVTEVPRADLTAVRVRVALRKTKTAIRG